MKTYAMDRWNALAERWAEMHIKDWGDFTWQSPKNDMSIWSARSWKFYIFWPGIPKLAIRPNH